MSAHNYVHLNSQERLIFKRAGARCEITAQRKAGGTWRSVPGGPHYVREFTAEPHPRHYSQFIAKFKSEPDYRAQFKQEMTMTEQKNGNGNGQPLPEAPASATAKMISPAGVEWLITARDSSVGALITKIGQLEETLLKHNWLPAGGSRPSSAPAGSQEGQGGQGEGWCPVHNVQMKWRSKPGEPGWYSHKATDGQGHEFWCRGK